MEAEVNGKVIQLSEAGWLENLDEWSEELAVEIAKNEKIPELTQEHWDIINYLRDEYFNNGGNQPNERAIVRAMSKKWGRNVTSQETYQLFPHMPSKQGGKIAGLPETRRKGGY